MKYFLLIALLFLQNIAITQTTDKPSVFSQLTNSSVIPAPPDINTLPELEVVSSILNSTNTLEDIQSQFGPDVESYKGNVAQTVPPIAQGVWWRFYTQTTRLFNIAAVSEEILSLAASQALWLQDVKTVKTVQSSSQRRLNVAYFNLFNNIFVVFFYKDQDPMSQEIRDKQGFFLRILSDGSYMQMSTTPNFDPEQSMYWRKFPNKKIAIQSEILESPETE